MFFFKFRFSFANGFESIIQFSVVLRSQVFFGTYHARMYLIADLFGINCATGMSVIMRKNVLDEAGGFQAFGKYLAEDYFFAQYMIDHGYKLSICSQPALQNSGLCDVSDFQSRVTR